MRGVALFKIMECLPILRVLETGRSFFATPRMSPFLEKRLADKRHGAFRQRASERAEHRPVVFGLRCRNGGVGVSHDCSRNRAALQHHVGLHSEKGRIPDTNVGKLSNFNRTDISRNALGDRGIDRVFRDISSSSEVVVLALFLRLDVRIVFSFCRRSARFG